MSPDPYRQLQLILYSRSGKGIHMKALVAIAAVLNLANVHCGDAAVIEQESAGNFAAETLALSLPEFPLAPGEEAFKCIYIELPLDRDYLMSGLSIRMPGGHHFGLWYTRPDAPFLEGIPKNEVVNCDEGLKTYVTGSEWDEFDLDYPPGMVSRIPQGSLLVLEAHYINASSTPSSGRSELTLKETSQREGLTELGYYLNAMDQFQVEPLQRVRFRARCPVDAGLNMVFLSSHMHAMGEEFRIHLVDDATGAKTPLYENFSYDNPLALKMFDSPVVTGPGQSLEWTCSYRNVTVNRLQGGPYGYEDVMCNMITLFWPATGTLPYCFTQPEIEPL